MKFEKLLAITTPWEMVYAKFVPIVIVPDVSKILTLDDDTVL